ncbi:MAG: gamma-glutamyltranspeptidase [Pseudomonadota bacterium]|jgi:gamma-glutamyltranspeptidase/glutathione hydrolase|uniref:gamma-glutamyltransferase n=1 Tax=Sandarakinorhabdus limnophila TaxID=210512 RepID=UPI0026F1547A|nr:gamma-glutamyltransferase [Sandarakinorhabdus limnophila]
MKTTLFIAASFLATAAVAQPIPKDADSGPIQAASSAGAGPFKAVVSAAHPLASEAGLSILKRGGSAADAAIATMLALTVVEPQSSGIGGGGFIVYQPANGPVGSIDGREKAPGVASPGQFLGPDGKPMPFMQAATGGRSVGVPGNVALAAEAHKKWGKLPWATLFEPAIKLAEGFTISPTMARFIAFGQDSLKQAGPEGRALYYDKDGAPLKAGTTFRNDKLAATLRLIAAKGADAFYKGPIAARIVKTVSTADANPTALTLADLAAYKAEVRDPVCGTYRQYKICGMGPPSSGGTGVLAMLKQLERFDMKGLGKDNPVSWHLFGESQRLAYADREKWIGDPGFVAVPTKGLADPAYLGARSALINAGDRMAKAEAGMPAGAPTARVNAADNEVAGTTNFAVADSAGNITTWTSTVEKTFGSGLVAEGFVLNNELTDFNFAPEDQGKLTANHVQPGKRPRSAMSPTIVYDSSGKAILAIGAAGGVTIIAQVTKAIIGVLDWGLPVEEAIALPQLIAIGDRFAVEKGTMLETMIPAFTAMGHKPVATALPLKLNGVQRVTGGWRGGADARGEGRPAGY